MTRALAALVLFWGCIEQRQAAVDDAGQPGDAALVDAGDARAPDARPDARPPPPDAAPLADDAAPPDAAPNPCPDGCPDGMVCRAGCVSLCDAAAIDGAAVGCAYAVAPIGSFFGGSHDYPEYFGLHIVNPHDRAAVVHVTNPRGPAEDIVVDPHARIVHLARPRPIEAGVALRARRISSTLPVSVVHSQLAPDAFERFSDDAVRLLPTHQLSTSYIVTGRPHDHGAGAISIANPSTDAPVDVEVIVAGPTAASAEVAALDAGEHLALTLAPLAVLTLETRALGDDLTGSWITGSMPLAVFAGSLAADVPSACIDGRCTLDPRVACQSLEDCTEAELDICCADGLEEQQLALSRLGTTYVAAPSDQANAPEYWRIVATVDETAIMIEPPQIAPITLGAGEWVEFATADCFAVHASAPIAVTQFTPSVLASDSDPSMVQLIPTTGWRRRHVFAPIDIHPDGDHEMWIVITGPRAAQVELDGQAVQLDALDGADSWASGWAFVGRGVHTVQSDLPVAVYQFSRAKNVSTGTHTGMVTR